MAEERAGWLSEAASNNLSDVASILTIVTGATATAGICTWFYGEFQKSRALRKIKDEENLDESDVRELEATLSADGTTILLSDLAKLKDDANAQSLHAAITKLKDSMKKRQ